MQLLRGFRRGDRSLSAKPHKMPGKLLGTHIPGVSPGRIAHSIDTILYRIKNDWFGTDSFHLFHLALNLSPGREQSLPDGGLAGILPDGNLCRGQSVQIEQHHHLTVRLCQKSNLAVDGIQQRLAVVLAILFAVLMGKERKYLFRVSLVHYVRITSFFICKIIIRIPCNPPKESVEVLDIALCVGRIYQFEYDVRTQLPGFLAVACPGIAEAEKLLHQVFIHDFQQFLFFHRSLLLQISSVRPFPETWRALGLSNAVLQPSCCPSL